MIADSKHAIRNVLILMNVSWKNLDKNKIKLKEIVKDQTAFFMVVLVFSVIVPWPKHERLVQLSFVRLSHSFTQRIKTSFFHPSLPLSFNCSSEKKTKLKREGSGNVSKLKNVFFYKKAAFLLNPFGSV